MDPLIGSDVYPATPGTFVQLSPEYGHMSAFPRGGQRRPTPDLAPELALVLAGVLLAAAEQVSNDKLELFGVSRREDLPIKALAMAFRDDDTGLTGDVFEWAVLLAVNSGDPAVTGLVTDALSLVGQRTVDQPQAVLVAAEPGRLVAFSPDLPERATLATGRRGRPPQVANLLREGNTSTWKADLLLGSGERWVSTSLKSNPIALTSSLRAAAATPHPPRIGITAGNKPTLVRQPDTGAVLVQVPVNSQTLGFAKLALRDVQEAFARHLSVPDSPMRQDLTGIGLQLYRWRNRTVEYAVSVLLDYAADMPTLTMSSPTSTGASVSDAHGSLIAVNSLAPEENWHYLPRVDLQPSIIRRSYANFDPID